MMKLAAMVALLCLHSPMLCADGRINFPISKWMSERLDISPESKITEVVTYGGLRWTNQYAFVVYVVDTDRGACYVFESAVIEDYVVYKFDSTADMLGFFDLRFKGIANDLNHGRSRPDARVGVCNGVDNDMTKALKPSIYHGYCTAIEEVLKSKGRSP